MRITPITRIWSEQSRAMCPGLTSDWWKLVSAELGHHIICQVCSHGQYINHDMSLFRADARICIDTVAEYFLYVDKFNQFF